MDEEDQSPQVGEDDGNLKFDTLFTRTKWCEACTLTPPYVAHDLLRECLELRREEVKSEN